MPDNSTQLRVALNALEALSGPETAQNHILHRLMQDQSFRQNFTKSINGFVSYCNSMGIYEAQANTAILILRKPQLKNFRTAETDLQQKPTSETKEEQKKGGEKSLEHDTSADITEQLLRPQEIDTNLYNQAQAKLEQVEMLTQGNHGSLYDVMTLCREAAVLFTQGRAQSAAVGAMLKEGFLIAQLLELQTSRLDASEVENQRSRLRSLDRKIQNVLKPGTKLNENDTINLNQFKQIISQLPQPATTAQPRSSIGKKQRWFGEVKPDPSSEQKQKAGSFRKKIIQNFMRSRFGQRPH